MTPAELRAWLDNDARDDSTAHLRDVDHAERHRVTPTWGPRTVTGCDCAGGDRHDPDCLSVPDRGDAW